MNSLVAISREELERALDHALHGEDLERRAHVLPEYFRERRVQAERVRELLQRRADGDKVFR